MLEGAEENLMSSSASSRSFSASSAF
jgi:hypothetical protein